MNNTYIAIPTGERTAKAVKCIEAWQAVGVKVCVYTWDKETKKALTRKRFPLPSVPKVDILLTGERQSFAILQNFMAKEIGDWDVLICGADDLYPSSEVELIPRAAEQVPGTILWAHDGLFGQQPTHPIITRQWYDAHDEIFDEGFKHNFCDTDLFFRCGRMGEIVDCRNFIQFDHRHPSKTGARKDSLYRYGDRTFAGDKAYFELKHSGETQLPHIRTLDIEVAA